MGPSKYLKKSKSKLTGVLRWEPAKETKPLPGRERANVQVKNSQPRSRNKTVSDGCSTVVLKVGLDGMGSPGEVKSTFAVLIKVGLGMGSPGEV